MRSCIEPAGVLLLLVVTHFASAQSPTDTFTLPSSMADVTVSAPPVWSIASMPLSMRFMSTC